MMRFTLFVLLAFVAASASAAPRQIGLNPPPPPATTSSVPGVGFSVVVPGYTAATWTTAQSAQLCAGLVNSTTGYPKSAIQCVVNAVTTTLPSSVNAVAAGGFLYFQSWPGIDANTLASATTARNLLISQLKQAGNNFLNATFSGANLNNTCDAAWAPAIAGAASGVLPLAGVPLAVCRIAPRGYDPVANAAAEAAVTQTALRFTAANVPASSVGAFGIDNGKTCASGPAFVTPGSSTTVAIITKNNNNQASTIVIAAAAADGTQTITITSAGGVNAYTWLADSVVPGYVLQLGGLVAADITVPGASAATCTAAALAAAINTNQFITSVGGFGANTGAITFAIPSLGCAAGTLMTAGAALPADPLTATGVWSPFCDSSNTFYSNYNPSSAVANTGTFGKVCPRCATSGATNILFTYNGANRGQFCSGLTTRGVAGTPSTVWVAGITGSSCIGVGVTDYGAGNANTGKPMLPSTSVLPSGMTTANIFPTGGTNPQGGFSANAVMPYDPSTTAGTGSTAAYKNIALDTEWLVPCSTPAITQPTSTAITPVVGVTTGAGSCNTVSIFDNGGTSANGVAQDSYSEALLATQFNAAVAPAPPPPSPPTVVPSPAPASPPVRPPSPAVSPSPSPITPSPAPPVTCTYSGTYTIESVACSGKFIAYTNDPNSGACKNSTLMLRTAQQSKSPRNNWKLSATAVSGTVPTATGMIASGRSGKCTNDKYTNLAAANSSPTPRLAGSGWKNRIIPVDAAKGCNTVWIQAAGDNPFAGKYLGYGSCSSQTAFKWEAASSSSAIQWKLTKQ